MSPRPSSFDQHLWVDDLRPGSVVLWGVRDTPRVVREVSTHYRPGYTDKVWMVSFVIMRCSWTGRPNTAYLRAEVLRQGSPTNVRVKVEGNDWHEEFVRNINANKEDLTMTCCTVAGIN